MVYLPEIPSRSEVANFYRDYGSFKQMEATRLTPLRLLRATLADRHIQVLKQTGGLRGKSLIDIGCSFGRFLQLARFCGAEVKGVELDEAAGSALRNLGIPWQKSLSGDEAADIVCAFQLIEHLEDPDALVAAIASAVGPDGRVLLAMPNGGEYEQVGESWVGFRVDLEHFNYFSVQTLSSLLSRHGLFVEQFWLHSQPVVPRPEAAPSGRLRRWFERLSFRLLADNEMAQSFNQGTFVLTVLARKVDKANGAF